MLGGRCEVRTGSQSHSSHVQAGCTMYFGCDGYVWTRILEEFQVAEICECSHLLPFRYLALHFLSLLLRTFPKKLPKQDPLWMLEPTTSHPSQLSRVAGTNKQLVLLPHQDQRPVSESQRNPTRGCGLPGARGRSSRAQVLGISRWEEAANCGAGTYVGATRTAEFGLAEESK